jgi:NhaP-type Na+/H+ or K+/H+ antiporter
MTEIIVSLVTGFVLLSVILCGLYVVMTWPGVETQDFKTQDSREEAKNRRIAAELKARRKGGDE